MRIQMKNEEGISNYIFLWVQTSMVMSVCLSICNSAIENHFKSSNFNSKNCFGILGSREIPYNQTCEKSRFLSISLSPFALLFPLLLGSHVKTVCNSDIEANLTSPYCNSKHRFRIFEICTTFFWVEHSDFWGAYTSLCKPREREVLNKLFLGASNNIQLPTFDYIRLLIQPYDNEVTFRE